MTGHQVWPQTDFNAKDDNWNWFGRRHSLPARGNTPTSDHKDHNADVQDEMWHSHVRITNHNSGGKRILRNLATFVQHYTESDCRRQHTCMLIFLYKRTREPLQRLSIQRLHSTTSTLVNAGNATATAMGPADNGLPKSMQQADISLASQEIPLVHNSQLLCPCREPDDPCSFNIHFNAILSSTPRSAKRSLSYRFPNQNPVRISLPQAIRPSQPPPSDHPNILSPIQAIKLSLRKLLPPGVTCSLLALNNLPQ
jgi:hypothetical protein